MKLHLGMLWVYLFKTDKIITKTFSENNGKLIFMTLDVERKIYTLKVNMVENCEIKSSLAR